MNPVEEVNSLVASLPNSQLPKEARLLPTGQGNGLRHLPYQSPSPTHYQQSASSGSIVEQDYLEDEDSLHNVKLPFFEIKHEKMEHRIMCFLKAQGFSNTEIAEKTGYGNVQVGQVLRQPWAAKRVIEEIQKAGRDEVEILLKGEARASVERLVMERDNAPKASDRISAADKLLDRLYGKPNQAISLTAKVAVSNDMSDAQLAAIAMGQTNVTATS